MIILLPGKRLRKLAAFVAVGLPTALYVLYVIKLRAGISANPAYTIDTDLSLISLTYLRQLSGAIPFSALIWPRGGKSVLDALNEQSVFHLLLLTATVCLAVIYRLKLVEIPSRRVLLVFIIGLNFLLGPNITTSLSSRWQNEVSWGLSYLSVSFSYTGVALITFSILFVLSIWTIKSSVMSHAVLFLFLVFFSIAAVSNHQLLNDNANATQIGRDQRDLYELSVREGFLSEVPNSSVIVYPSFDENIWVNTYFTAWLGGPKDLVFVRTTEESQKICNPDILFERCPRIFQLEYTQMDTLSVALSLTELDNGLINSQHPHRYFGQELSIEELQAICPKLIKAETERGMMYSCN